MADFMTRTTHTATVAICPFIDRADMRCASRLSLDHLKDAFDLCVGNHQNCPVFRQMRHEQANSSGKQFFSTCPN